MGLRVPCNAYYELIRPNNAYRQTCLQSSWLPKPHVGDTPSRQAWALLAWRVDLARAASPSKVSTCPDARMTWY